MNQITSPPNIYDFGESFNYSQWTENTVLTLCNVRWTNDYRDVWRASSKDALNAYIDGQSSTDKLVLSNVSLAKFNRNVRINTPINKAQGYNYLRASNGSNPVGDIHRDYYYFVLDTIQVNPNTTELVLQLDVWQTYGYDVTLGNAFVERGHIGIANTNAMDNHGRDYLAIPEGLDTGSQYRVMKTAKSTVMDVSSDQNPNYSILICSVNDLEANPGTIKQPRYQMAQGSVVDGIPSGAKFYLLPTLLDFKRFMNWFSLFPWVAQGITNITIIPKITRYHSETLYNCAQTMSLVDINGTTQHADFTMYWYPDGLSQSKTTALSTAWRDTFLNILPAQYRMLKKLLVFPYCMIELTTWTGQPLVIHPEAWDDDDATIREQAVMMPPGQRIAFMPYRYNGDDATTAASDDDHGEHLDFATTITGFPSVPLVNSGALLYLANNARGLAFEFRSADWSQTKALRGAQATSDVAGAEIRNTGRQAINNNSAAANASMLQTNAMMGNALLGQAGGALNIVGGIGAAGAFGAESAAAGQTSGIGKTGQLGTGMMQAGTDAMLNSDLMVNSNLARGTSANYTMETQGSIRDTNVGLARFSARGDYQNTVAGINAKIQDSSMIQPSMAGQFGGDAMNLAHSNVEVSARWKMIDNSTLKRIGNFWLRYGYAVETWLTADQIPDDFACMTKFTYWKFQETYITAGRIPEQFKQTIRGILEKGVTVWTDPSYIGTTSLFDNQPKTGISY